MGYRALALVALVGMVAGAGAQPRPPQLTRVAQYYNPAWRPDSRTLVFESTLEGVYSIYRIDADGSGLQRLTDTDANNEQPSWSPDGRRIVFSSDRAGHLDLYLMDADGSNQARLTHTPGGGFYQSSFSRDGRRIVFQGSVASGETRDRIYVVASDGSGMRQLTDSTYGAEGPVWSSDGTTITFDMVPYPKRLWSEMSLADRATANAGARRMSIRLDGSHLEPALARAVADSVHTNPAPDGRHAAYTKTVDGWPGLYVYELGTRTERLITGGRGVGPLGYLRSATLTESVDTIDTYGSARGGPATRGNGAFLVRASKRLSGGRFELTDTWYDASGKETARQSVRTGRGTVATEGETVRATGDSASMLVTPDRVTGWVVPQGEPPRLFDGAATGERYAAAVAMSAIARAKPAVGAVFLAPVSSLYGGNPIQTQVDSIRVLRRDTVMRGASRLPVLVLERLGGGQTWMDETTGAEVLSRGNAGPNQWWWHIRRGVTPPKP